MMSIAWVALYSLAGPGVEDSGFDAKIPREMCLADDQEQAPAESPFPRPDRLQPASPHGAGGGFLDLGRLEAELFVGMAISGGSDLVGGILVRAPMPWLSPEGNADGEHFGLFAQLEAGSSGGNFQGDSNGSGGASLNFALGVDYTLMGGDHWLLRAQLGVQLGSLDGGNVGESVGPLIGIEGGLRIFGNVWIVLTPQVTYSSGGGWLETSNLGVRVVF